MSVLYLSGFTLQAGSSLTDLADSLREQGYETTETTVSGAPAVDCTDIFQDDEGDSYYERYVVIQNGDFYISLDYMIPESYLGEAQPLFQSILDSVSVEPVE